jgi:hypothetical protein
VSGLLTSCHPGAGREIIYSPTFPPSKKKKKGFGNENKKGGVRVQHFQ